MNYNNNSFLTHNQIFANKLQTHQYTISFPHYHKTTLETIIFQNHPISTLTPNNDNLLFSLENYAITSTQIDTKQRPSAFKAYCNKEQLQLNNISQEFSHPGNLEFQQTYQHHQEETRSISTCLDHKTGSPNKITEDDGIYEFPTTKFSPLQTKLFQNQQQKINNKKIYNKKIPKNNKINQQSKQKQISALLQLYNLQQIPSKKSQKKTIKINQTKLIKKIYKISKKYNPNNTIQKNIEFTLSKKQQIKNIKNLLFFIQSLKTQCLLS